MPCFRPINVPKRGYQDLRIDVPCGQCTGCRLDKARDWTTRLVHESKLHQLCTFVTLTYDDEHLPVNGSLVKRHVQLFMKRLRKLHEPAQLRYFLCGEYGDTTLRPHYHAVLFGIDFADKRKHSIGRQGDVLYVSKTLDDVWGLGHCYVGNVTRKSAGYVARYCLKKVGGDLAAAHYGDRIPEFALMSRRPGLGAGWYEKFSSDLYPSDFVVVEGKRSRVPAFYDKRLKRSDPGELTRLKEVRVSNMRKHRVDHTPARLRVREEVLKARISTFLKRSSN